MIKILRGVELIYSSIMWCHTWWISCSYFSCCNCLTRSQPTSLESIGGSWSLAATAWLDHNLHYRKALGESGASRSKLQWRTPKNLSRLQIVDKTYLKTIKNKKLIYLLYSSWIFMNLSNNNWLNPLSLPIYMALIKIWTPLKVGLIG